MARAAAAQPGDDARGNNSSTWRRGASSHGSFDDLLPAVHAGSS
ncbi:hypothetical protein ACP4OV_027743 [Aristida adscensionis]